MTIAFVGSSAVFANINSASTAGPVSIASGVNPTVGHLVVVSVSWVSTTVTSSTVSDTLGNVWTRQGSTVGAANTRMEFWTTVVTSGAAADTYKASFSANVGFPEIMVVEYSTTLSGWAFVGYNAGHGSAGGTASSGNVTYNLVGSDNAVFVSSNAQDNNTTGTEATWTNRFPAGTGVFDDILEDKIVTATTTAAGTSTGNFTNWTQQLVVMMETAAAAVPEDGYAVPTLPPDLPFLPSYAEEIFFGLSTVTEDGVVIFPLPPEQPPLPPNIDEPMMGTPTVTEDGAPLPPLPPEQPPLPPNVDEAMVAPATLVTEDGVVIFPLPPEQPPLPPNVDEPMMGTPTVTEDGAPLPPLPPEQPPLPPNVDEPMMGTPTVTEDGQPLPPLPPEQPPLPPNVDEPMMGIPTVTEDGQPLPPLPPEQPPLPPNVDEPMMGTPTVTEDGAPLPPLPPEQPPLPPNVDEPMMGIPTVTEDGQPLPPLPPEPPPLPPTIDEPTIAATTTALVEDVALLSPLPPEQPPLPSNVDEPMMGTPTVTEDGAPLPLLPPEQPPLPPNIDEPTMGTSTVTEDGQPLPQLPPDPPPLPPTVDEPFLGVSTVTEDGQPLPQLPPEPPPLPPIVDEPFLGVSTVVEDGVLLAVAPIDLPLTYPWIEEQQPLVQVPVAVDDGFAAPVLPPELPPVVFFLEEQIAPTPPPPLSFEEVSSFPPLPPLEPQFLSLLVFADEPFPPQPPTPPPGPFFTPGSGTGGGQPQRLEIVDVHYPLQFFFAYLADQAVREAEERRRQLRLLGVIAAVRQISSLSFNPSTYPSAHSSAHQAAGNRTSPPASPTPVDVGALAAAAAMALVAAAREREEKAREGGESGGGGGRGSGAASPRYPMTTSGRVPRTEIRVSRSRRALVAHDLGWLQLEKSTAKRMHAAGVEVKVLGFRNTLDDLHAAPRLEGDDFELAVRAAKMSPVVQQRAAPENFAARDREAVAFFAREEDVARARSAELRAMTPMVATIVAAPGGGSEDSPGPAMILCASTADGDLVLPSGSTRVGEEVRVAAARACKDCGVEVVAEEMRLAWVGEGPGQITWYVFAATQWMQVSSPSHVTWAPPRALMSQASPRVKTVYERALRAVAVGQLV